jgi:hypothetical protein
MKFLSTVTIKIYLTEYLDLFEKQHTCTEHGVGRKVAQGVSAV